LRRCWGKRRPGTGEGGTARGRNGLPESVEAPVKYGEGFVKVLSAIGDEFGKPCGKLLVPVIKGMIEFLVESEHPQYGIPEEIRKLLLEVSVAEADILLKPARKALAIKGISTTRSIQTPLRR
jgi:hypothetical protein